MKEITRIQHLWRYEKYHVMMHDYRYYIEIKELIKQGADYLTIEQRIHDILQTPIRHSAFVNTFQHLWGYFKSVATDEEMKSYLSYIEQLHHHHVSHQTCLIFIQNLTRKYQNPYLLQSAIMDL